MAWTAPRTWGATDTPTAAQLNSNIRDDLNFLRSAHGVKLYSTTATISSPATATDYSVQFNSEALDTDAFHSGTFLTRITVPTGFDGQFQAGGIVEFAASATGVRQAKIRLNGTTDLAMVRIAHSVNGISWTPISTMAVGLVSGDYLEMVVQQTSGGALGVIGGAEVDTQFWAYYLGS